MARTRSSSDQELRALRREAAGGAPAERERWVWECLRRGELPMIGREIMDLPAELRDPLARERVLRGRCAWCGGFEPGRARCCCARCFVDVGVLCFHCPRRESR
ncbi:MAG: hypothetical protein AB7N76_20415 [Planctomycetota bacterium]